MLRFLLDHNVPLSVGRSLQTESYDVRLVKELDPEMKDEDILRLAQLEHRIVLTNDNDFVGLAPFFPKTDVILFDCQSRSADIRIRALQKILPDLKQPFGLLEVQT